MASALASSYESNSRIMKVTVELHHRLRTDGRRAIQIKVRHKGKRHRTNTEIYIKKSDFKFGAKWGEWIKTSHPEADKLNKQLRAKIEQVKDHYNTHQVINPKVAIHGSDFFNFAEMFIKIYDNDENEGTYLTYKSKLNKLEEFIGKRELSFDEITIRFINSYIVHRKAQGNRINTIATDLKKIRAIINQAVKEELIDYRQNPFLKIKIESERTGKEKLTEKELNDIRVLDLTPGEWLWDARNIFLFCLNCMGERIGAVLRLKKANLRGNTLSYLKGKGKKSKNVELTPEAKKILSCYPDTKEYLFPYLEGTDGKLQAVKKYTAVINKALKSVALKAGIERNISTHVARHTLTKILADKGVAMRTLQGMLDHSTVATTEHYAGDLSDKSGNDVMKKYFGKTEKKKSNSRAGSLLR